MKNPVQTHDHAMENPTVQTHDHAIENPTVQTHDPAIENPTVQYINLLYSLYTRYRQKQGLWQ